MSARAFRERLLRRLKKANAPLPRAEAFERLETYYRLLIRWNEKINLTALPLEPATDATFDRLFVEPIAAARHLPLTGSTWFDVGSGGGSPAIPLKIACQESRLTMIESKARKAAFLREVARSLQLTETRVENERAEVIAEKESGTAEILTVRAVRQDAELAAVASRLLGQDGRLAIFNQSQQKKSLPGFACQVVIPLLDGSQSFLFVYTRAFHVEQRR